MRLLLVFGIAVALVVVHASPAMAHTRLAATEPTDGASLEASPDRVALTFDGPVHIGPGAVHLLTSTGEELPTGVGHQGARRDVVEALPPHLPPDAYTVTWRVISVDGDPVTGTFSFTIEAFEPLPAGPKPAPTSPVPDVDGATSGDGVAAARALSRFIGFAAMILLVAVALDATILRPTPVLVRRARLLALLAGSLVAVSSALGVTIGAAHAAGADFAQAIDPDVVRPFLETTPARAAIVRGTLALALVVGVIISHDALRRRSRATATAVTIVIVGTFAASGHAISGDHVRAAVVADFVHLLAVGVWLGGLASMLVLGGVHHERAARRFSAVAAWSVALIIATGWFAAWRQLRTLDHLTTTEYGRTLIVKLALVGVLLALGAVSRRTVRRWSHGRLARLVTAETVVAVLVLAATTTLVSTNPGMPSDPSATPHVGAAAVDNER